METGGSRKTILFPVYDGTITKNLLRTDFLKYLTSDPDVRVVLLPPAGKLELYQKEFEDGTQVFVEPMPIWNHDWLEFAFAELYVHSIPTNFMRIRQVDWYWNKGKYLHYVGASVLRTLGRYSVWKKLLRVLNHLEPIPNEVRYVYDKWKPDLVFAPTMIPRAENALMRLARRDNKKVVGMAKSFDNLTSKAFLRMHPDRLIVPNEAGIDEAYTLYQYPRERVSVTGICQYDIYTQNNLIEDRSVFLKKIGLDPLKKTILYAPAGDWMNPTDHEVLGMILGWIDDGTLPNTQVLLRLHPAYESRTQELDGHHSLLVERPGKHFGSLKSYEFDHTDVQHLANSLKHADVVVNTASTLMVEGSIFDTPVIALGFDGLQKKKYWKSVIRYYDREHLVPVVSVGGFRMPKTKEELRQAVVGYLEHPEYDRVDRKEVVRTVCYAVDGKSCERTSQIVLCALSFNND